MKFALAVGGTEASTPSTWEYVILVILTAVVIWLRQVQHYSWERRHITPGSSTTSRTENKSEVYTSNDYDYGLVFLRSSSSTQTVSFFGFQHRKWWGCRGRAATVTGWCEYHEPEMHGCACRNLRNHGPACFAPVESKGMMLAKGTRVVLSSWTRTAPPYRFWCCFLLGEERGCCFSRWTFPGVYARISSSVRAWIDSNVKQCTI